VNETAERRLRESVNETAERRLRESVNETAERRLQESANETAEVDALSGIVERTATGMYDGRHMNYNVTQLIVSAKTTAGRPSCGPARVEQ